MTFNEAVAQHAPAWVGLWINILLLGAIILPLSLFFWKATRSAAAFALIAGIIGGAGVMLLYGHMGYVKLLGLPHILAWTPLAIFFWYKMKSPDVTRAPRIIMGIALATIMISLAFDYTDTIRYVAGERTPLALPASHS